MVITRFAPSPTGDLHVGSARTALYAFLYAKHHQGQYKLRIEDTDRERSTQAAVAVILDGLQWLGIESEQAPVYQTERLSRYQDVANQLVVSGHAYRCYLTKAELDAMREAQIERNENPKYNRHSRDLNLADTGELHVIRFKNPLTGTVTFRDHILGDISIANDEMDDFILIRSNGMPTYNFAVVVDDADMNVSHVIRGNDHVNNTVRQLNVYRALGLTPPEFAHLPMIAGADGKKLSKRHGAVSVLQYRADGFLPHALCNYLVRLGWSHGDQEIFSLDDMIMHFDFDSVSKSPAIFDIQKLKWLNQHYFKTLPWDELMPHVTWYLNYANLALTRGPALADIVDAYRERVVTLDELVKHIRCYYEDELRIDSKIREKWLTSEGIALLKILAEKLSALDRWELETLKEVVNQVVKAQNVKFPAVGQPLRVALTGNTQSPSIDHTLWLMGRERTLARLRLDG